jgi:hypothetical protein
MPRICVKVSEKESVAIEAYAMMCGESASELMLKIVIQEITFMKNDISKKPEVYEYNMMMPVDIADHDEIKIIETNCNKIREIIGLKKINICGDRYD